MSYERDNIRRMHGYTWGEQPEDSDTIKLNTNINTDNISVFQLSFRFRYPVNYNLIYGGAECRGESPVSQKSRLSTFTLNVIPGKTVKLLCCYPFLDHRLKPIKHLRRYLTGLPNTIKLLTVVNINSQWQLTATIIACSSVSLS